MLYFWVSVLLNLHIIHITTGPDKAGGGQEKGESKKERKKERKEKKKRRKIHHIHSNSICCSV